jgi:hypothetical protein
MKHPINFLPLGGRTCETSGRNAAGVNIAIAGMTYAKPNLAMGAVGRSEVMREIGNLDLVLAERNPAGREREAGSLAARPAGL